MGRTPDVIGSRGRCAGTAQFQRIFDAPPRYSKHAPIKLESSRPDGAAHFEVETAGALLSGDGRFDKLLPAYYRKPADQQGQCTESGGRIDLGRLHAALHGTDIR